MTEDRAVPLAELLEEVRRIEAQSTRLVAGIMAGGYSSVFRGSGIEFQQIREYAEGDDPRSVDWNVTARIGRPFVKEFVEERERTLLFVLDLSASMSGGFGHWSARQMAARICACLALAAIESDDRVGLVAFSDGIDRFTPPRKGIRHVLRIVRDCLALPAGAPGTALTPAIEFATRALRRRAIVFVVSDFLGDGWQHAMTLCGARHDVVAVQMLAPEMVAAPNLGLAEVRDPETGCTRLVDWSDSSQRERYETAVTSFRDRTREGLRRAGVDVMEVPIPRRFDRNAVARPILDFFRMREQRGAKR
jgi:uncharacterized protein (DUF58 family)